MAADQLWLRVLKPAAQEETETLVDVELSDARLASGDVRRRLPQHAVEALIDW